MSTVKKAAAVAKRHTKDNMDVGMMCDVSTLALRTYLCGMAGRDMRKRTHRDLSRRDTCALTFCIINIIRATEKRAIQILIASEIRNRTEHINTNSIRTYRFVVNTAL
jgi:hypothetical protein